MGIEECYGMRFGRLPECPGCEYREYCKDAGDPPLLSNDAGGFDMDRIAAIPQEPPQRLTKKYTTADMARILRFFLDIDAYAQTCRKKWKMATRMREILFFKITNPDISLRRLGEKYGISKQAVSMGMNRIIKQIPELEPIFRNRPTYNLWRETSKLHHLYDPNSRGKKKKYKLAISPNT